MKIPIEMVVCLGKVEMVVLKGMLHCKRLQYRGEFDQTMATNISPLFD